MRTEIAKAMNPELNSSREIGIGESRAVAIDGDSETAS